MSLNSNALTTVANQKSYLGITVSTYDTLLEIFINGCSAWIERKISRVLIKPASDAVELHDGDFDATGRYMIFARQYPIASITSIEYKSGSLGSPTWVAFNSNDYTFDAEAGIIYFNASLSSILPNRQNIRLTYKGGYASGSVPSDLELACLKMVAKEFDKRKSQGVTSEGVGGGNVGWNEDVDPSILSIIKTFRRFV